MPAFGRWAPKVPRSHGKRISQDAVDTFDKYSLTAFAFSTMKYLATIVLLVTSLIPLSGRAEVVIDFEELNSFTGTSGNSDNQPGGQYYNGNDGSNGGQGRTNSDGWSSGSGHFSNNYFTDFGGYWSGWAYSNVVNSVSPYFQNQYAAFPGGGSNGTGGVDVGGNYALAYTGSEVGISDAFIRFSGRQIISSLDFANTTWVALYARDNNPPFYSDRANFEDGDYLRVIFEGLDASDQVIGSESFSLVDFAGAGAEDNFILNQWSVANLTGLGAISGLRVRLDSNLFSTFGGVDYLDPPAYVAIDNLRLTAVPEPSSILGLAVLGVGFFVKRRGAKGLNIRA